MRFFREWNSTPRNVCRTDSFCNQLGSVAQRSRIILLSSLLLSALPTILTAQDATFTIPPQKIPSPSLPRVELFRRLAQSNPRHRLNASSTLM